MNEKIIKNVLKSFVTHETYMAGCKTKEGYIPEDCIQKIVDKLKNIERVNKIKTIDQKEIDLIMDIADRAWEKMKDNYPDRLSLMMDIDCANRDCGLKLQELANADDENFYHDIAGICFNLNRQTKKLENCFVPRYAK